MSEEVVIKVENVSKNFVLPHDKINSVKGLFTNFTKKRKKHTTEVQHALSGIDFEIKKGEFFGIVGRNGSGKSTLLKILAGIYQPTSGKVTVSGKLVPFIELGVGFNPELTGRENVYLNGAMLGFSEKEINKMYKDIVEFAELERFMDQKLKNYSSGMQVRLAFSMATRAEADILLVDEVLAVGDADFQRKCFEYFRQLKKNKKTVVFVTHEMNAVREYCDRAILVEDSKIVTEDSSDKVALAYTRMFNQEASTEEDETNKRWGDKKVVFEEIKLSKNKLLDADEELVIRATIKANSSLDNIETSFLVKDGGGTHILGTDNKIKGQKINLAKDEKIEIELRIPNIFSEGLHSIDLKIQHDGTVNDWWEDAVNFTSLKDQKSGYLVDPNITLSIQDVHELKENE
ncbi:MAG: ABC transporter ATP-binding protein [bacterium]